MDMATPEEFVAAKEEFLHCMDTALAGMPIQWRRALRLHYAGGFTSAQLSEVLDEDVPGAAQPGRRSVRWHQPRPTFATSKMETPDFTVILTIAADRDAGLGALLTP